MELLRTGGRILFHSLFNARTGFASATLNVSKLTVRIVINTAMTRVEKCARNGYV